MGLSEEEKNKLQIFSKIKLDRNQIDVILGRQLTNAEWKSMTKDYRKIFTPIAKQAANTACFAKYKRISQTKLCYNI